MNTRRNKIIIVDNVTIDQTDDSFFFFISHHSVTDAMLMALYSIFGKVLRGAVELIEENAITMLVVKDNSLRTDQYIYQVK